MASTGATSVLGLAFWALAARLHPAAAVGRASAVVSAATLLGVFAQLNLSAVFTRFLPVAGHQALRLVIRGYALTVGLAIVVSAGFVATGAADVYLASGLGARAAFVALTALLMAAILNEAVLTALRRAHVVLVGNVVVSSSKVALLVLAAFVAVGDLEQLGGAVVLSWLLPLAVVTLWLGALILTRWLPDFVRSQTGPDQLPGPREMFSFVVAEYVKSLVSLLAPAVIPLMIVHSLGADATAWFTVPWMINNAFKLLFYNIGASFVVHTLSGTERPSQALTRVLRLEAAVVVGGFVVEFFAGGLLLSLIGRQYADQATGVFRWLALGLIFEAVAALYGNFVWLERRLWHLVLLQVVNSVVMLGMTQLLLPGWGIGGAGAAYFVSQAVLGLGALRPTLRRVRRWRRDADPLGEGARDGVPDPLPTGTQDTAGLEP